MSASFHLYLVLLFLSQSIISLRIAVYGFQSNYLFQRQKVQQHHSTILDSTKQELINNLDYPNKLNEATSERTLLVKSLCEENPTTKPGSTKSFSPFAPGTWRIIYAPHISTMAKLGGGGSFDPVYYILRPDGTMTSHAKYRFPFIGQGWLSVSGTYSSQDENMVCRVDFDKAWVKMIQNDSDNDNSGPFDTLEDVPDTFTKTCINQLGKFAFLESVSIFPVSYLDNDMIVFDFELLGTRICARKVKDKIT